MFKRILPTSEFTKAVTTLITGTGLAQLLPIALSPLLTRLYNPEEFGVFALYASICAILMVFVTGKYELAIIVAKRDIEAINLVAVTTALSLLISLVLLSILLVFENQIALLFTDTDVGRWPYIIPVTIFILGFYYALSFWANRRSCYKDMAISRVLQSGASGSVQVAGGFFSMGIWGLILGQIGGQLVATVFLTKIMIGGQRNLFRSITLKRMYFVAKKHISYPKYLSPSQFMSVGAAEFPLLLSTMFFGTSVAAFYSLAQRVMAAPLSLLASAIGDVYRQKAAAHYASHGECRHIFLSSFRRLFIFAVIPILPVLLLGPSLFAFIFGENWRTAGEIASALSVLVFFQTLFSTLSSTVLFPGWLRFEFFWQLARLSLTTAVFYFCFTAEISYRVTIICYVLLFSFMYVLHGYFQYKAARGDG